MKWNWAWKKVTFLSKVEVGESLIEVYLSIGWRWKTTFYQLLWRDCWIHSNIYLVSKCAQRSGKEVVKASLGAGGGSKHFLRIYIWNQNKCKSFLGIVWCECVCVVVIEPRCSHLCLQTGQSPNPNLFIFNMYLYLLRVPFINMVHPFL